jgi:hypothetical protein
MALDIVAGTSPAFGAVGGWLSAPGLISPRFDERSRLQARDNSTASNSTVNLFLGSGGAEFRDWDYAASIITACVDQTVYAIQCTSAPQSVGSATCGPNAPVSEMFLIRYPESEANID